MANNLVAAALALLLVGCGDAAPPVKLPDVARVFPHLPLPPRGRLVSRTGSLDALQITLRTDVDAGRVTEYYRKTLGARPWRLVSDVRDPEGTTVLYAEQNRRPLWVRIWSEKEGDGTLVELSGAVVESDSGQSGSSMSSDRSQLGFFSTTYLAHTTILQKPTLHS